MNNKLLALILIFLVTVVNFNNCADKAKEEAQAMPLFGQGSLAELVKEFKDIKEYAQNANANVLDPNFKQFKERALKLFDKFNNEALKQKVGSIKHYREFLIQAGLYPKDKIDLEGQLAIKAYEDALENEFYNVLKSYFVRLVNNTPFDITDPAPGIIQTFPINIGSKRLTYSDIFYDKKRALYWVIRDSNLSPEQAAQFIVQIFGEDINNPVFYDSTFKNIPVLIKLALEVNELFPPIPEIEALRSYRIIKSDIQKKKDLDTRERILNIIKALIRFPEVNIDVKSSYGGVGLDKLNPRFYEEYIKQKKDALKRGLENELPVSALRDLAAGYVN